MTRDLILARDVTQSIEPPIAPPSMTIHRVASVNDAGFPFLEQIYDNALFPRDWLRKRLDRGSQSVVIVSDRNPTAAPAAAAMLMRSPSYVQEIHRTFDPGPQADYYYGDFVAPGFRGRHLQRLLIHARLMMTQQAGRRSALAMTRAAIPASLDNYLAEGFRVAVELRVCNVPGFRIERHYRIDPALACGTLSQEGFRLPFSYILRRAK